MDFGCYEKIAEELFPKAANLFFCSGCEPLLYPRMRDALKLAGKWKVRTSMVSNGMLLSRNVANEMDFNEKGRESQVAFRQFCLDDLGKKYR
ncbi:MAG: hypothetical protein GY846_05410 [Deltaproteobacteria bacterium]|nr:hypothetical protein [Deltaproteobacteria bacterium]